MVRIRLSAVLALAFSAAVWAQPYRVLVEDGVAVKMRDGVTLAADVYRPDAPGKFPVLLQRTPYNRAGATEPRQNRLARLRGRDAGHARALRFRGRVLPVPLREPGRLRHRRVGRRAAVRRRQGGDVRRLLRGRDADARGHGHAAAPGGDLPLRHRVGILRRLDLPGRRADAVVRQFLVERPGGGHAAPPQGDACSNPKQWVDGPAGRVLSHARSCRRCLR